MGALFLLMVGLFVLACIVAVVGNIAIILARVFIRPRRLRREDLRRASLVSLYGMRSPDGQWWWDGQQWQPVPR